MNCRRCTYLGAYDKMNKRHYEHTLPNIRGSLSNTYDKKKLGFYSDNPSFDRSAVKEITPASKNRTQVAVNSEGKTNEATKKVKEPLKKGQDKPTEKQKTKQDKKEKQEQADKPKQSRGRKR